MSDQEKCALCLLEKPLKRSHIIPEFLYKSIYDPDPKRYYQIATDADKKPVPRQLGIWEKLLCGDCEQKIGRWEAYAAKLLYEDASPVPEEDKIVFKGVDYKLFKLFQLSILWRSGVSSRPEFSQVKLGPHQERLRKMLLNEDPGKVDQYGCMIVMNPDYYDFLEQMILAPNMGHSDAHHVYRFMFAGCFWAYFVSSHKAFDEPDLVLLNENRELTILKESHYSKQFVQQLYSDFKEAGHLDNLLNKGD